MKISKKILSIVLAVIMIITIIPITASAVTSGTCGDNLTWNYDKETYTLTISGTGAMDDYGEMSRPWDSFVIYDEIIYNEEKDYYYRTYSGIKNIIIENGVTSIGDYAFSQCNYLTDITLCDTINSIGVGAFRYCLQLKKIDIPDAVTSIGDYAFSVCEALTDVKIPDGVISIEEGCFSSCISLTKIEDGNNVKYIENYAFDNCKKLKNYIFPNNLRRIETGAFYGCSSLKSVILPDTVRVIGNEAFYNCMNITELYLNDGLTVIESGAFYNCAGITSVSIPDSVEEIGKRAFYNCTSLTDVYIGESVITIGESGDNWYYKDNALGGVFAYCDALNNITVSENNLHYKSVDGVLFDSDLIYLYLYPSAKNDTEYTVPYGIRYISSYAFERNSSLEKVIITNSVYRIGDYAFSCCGNLKSLRLGNNVYYIGDFALAGCYNLQEFIIGDSLTSIDNYLFSGCSQLKEITIPKNVISINRNTFEESKATIYCYVDSYAYEYACKYGYDFVELTEISSCDADSVTIEEIQMNSLPKDVSLKTDVVTNDDNSFLYDIYLEQNGKQIQPNSDVNVRIQLNPDIYDNAFVYHINDNGDYEDMQATYKEALFNGVECAYVLFTTDHFSKFLISPIDLISCKHENCEWKISFHATCIKQGKKVYKCLDCDSILESEIIPIADHIYHNGVCSLCGEFNKTDIPDKPDTEYSFYIKTPSTTAISHKDGIILYAQINGNVPDGSYVEWTYSNYNFKTTLQDNNSLKIISDKNGTTTFTATLYSADGDVLATDSIEMKSKAGFFDKIGSFFRSIFGGTKIYEN